MKWIAKILEDQSERKFKRTYLYKMMQGPPMEDPEGEDGSDLMESLLRERPKQQKLDDEGPPSYVEKGDDNDQGDSRRDKSNKGWGYLTPPESEDDDSDDDHDDDKTYVPDEEEEEVERRIKEEVEHRRNIPQPSSLKAYVNVPIPSLWEETIRIYSAVKQIINDGYNYKEDNITQTLAENIIDTLKKKY